MRSPPPPAVQRLVLVHVMTEADDPAYMQAMVKEANEVFDGCVFGGADGLSLDVSRARLARLPRNSNAVQGLRPRGNPDVSYHTSSLP